VRSFEVDPLAYDEFLDAAAWYAEQGIEGLAERFVAEIEALLRSIRNHDEYVTAPMERIEGAVVRRELARRFPYMVVFVENATMRKVIVIRRSDSDPERWRARAAKAPRE
jgi:hypothetical protein